MLACLAACPTGCVPVCLAACMYVWLHICLTGCMSDWLAACLVGCAHVHACVCLRVCVPACLYKLKVKLSLVIRIDVLETLFDHPTIKSGSDSFPS